MPDPIKISIVTVVLNDADNIEKTLISVVGQDVENLEYIVIDGGSADGTLDIIEKYRDRIDLLVSEKDDGIYDAMNKAIALASGECLCFMNSGDVFERNNSVSELFLKRANMNADVIYADHKIIYPTKIKITKALPVSNIWKGSAFSHQSCFVRREVLNEVKFNEVNRITADYELFYRLYKMNKVFEYVPVLVAAISSGGVSDIKRIDSIVSRWNIQEKTLKVNLYYMKLVIIEIVKRYVKRLLRIGV